MKIDVYVEVGEKRTFAGAIEWPGWCRSGKDEETALQALLAYGSRYRAAVGTVTPGFRVPAQLSELNLIDRLRGSTTTDFGAPGAAPAYDRKKVEPADLRRYEKILTACWRQFDKAVRAASGKTLRTGPRGGGRDLQKMVAHVIDADNAYLSGLGWSLGSSLGKTTAAKAADSLRQMRAAMLEGLRAAAKGSIPEHGPRGGRRWSPRYFVRRVAWHVLDHAWELEDRLH